MLICPGEEQRSSTISPTLHSFFRLSFDAIPLKVTHVRSPFAVSADALQGKVDGRTSKHVHFIEDGISGKSCSVRSQCKSSRRPCDRQTVRLACLRMPIIDQCFERLHTELTLKVHPYHMHSDLHNLEYKTTFVRRYFSVVPTALLFPERFDSRGGPIDPSRLHWIESPPGAGLSSHSERFEMRVGVVRLDKGGLMLG